MTFKSSEKFVDPEKQRTTTQNHVVEESSGLRKPKVGDLVEFSGYYVGFGSDFAEETMSIDTVRGLVVEVGDPSITVRTIDMFCSFSPSSDQTIWRIVSIAHE